jgi:hypothetical protein
MAAKGDLFEQMAEEETRETQGYNCNEDDITL